MEMINVFVKNKVIDKDEIQRVIASRDLITYDSLKKDWDAVLEMSKNLKLESKNNEFNFYEMYEIVFGSNLYGLTLDELEYISENNLFEFDENNILDYRCKMNLERRINYYKQNLSDLTNCLQKGNVGSYFSKYSDLFHMAGGGIEIATFLGLNRNGVELTPDGEKLKACIENIRQLHYNEIKQRSAAYKSGSVKR